MIDSKVFENGMKLLELNYDRALPQEIKALWLKHLNKHLNSEEFLIACKHIILHSRFMPTASELVEHIRGSKEAQALIEWRRILEASASIDSIHLAYLSTRAKVALHAIGGIRAVGLADEYKRSRMEKSFITVYCQCSDKDAHMLPQKSTSATPETPEDTEEYVPMPEHIREKLERLFGKRDGDIDF